MTITSSNDTTAMTIITIASIRWPRWSSQYHSTYLANNDQLKSYRHSSISRRTRRHCQWPAYQFDSYDWHNVMLRGCFPYTATPMSLASRQSSVGSVYPPIPDMLSTHPCPNSVRSDGIRYRVFPSHTMADVPFIWLKWGQGTSQEPMLHQLLRR